MKFAPRHFVAATLIFCPLLVSAQELPSAPSAVIAQHSFAAASEITFTTPAAWVTTPSASSRLSSEQKFSSFVEQSMSPYATFSSAIAAGLRPTSSNSQYADTYASRFGRTVSDQTEQGFFTKFLLPSMLGQDPRYHLSEDTGYVDRASYALSRVLIGRNDNGRPTFNAPELIGAVIAASLTTAYHPYHHPRPGEVVGNAAGTIGSDAGMNMLREFWPDIRERLMDRGPKMMQSVVTHVGPRIDGTAISPIN